MKYLLEHGFSVLDREKENGKHRDDASAVLALASFLDERTAAVADEGSFVRKKLQEKYVNGCKLSLDNLQDVLSLTGTSLSIMHLA